MVQYNRLDEGILTLVSMLLARGAASHVIISASLFHHDLAAVCFLALNPHHQIIFNGKPLFPPKNPYWSQANLRQAHPRNSLPPSQRATAQHGWAWHRELHHLVHANCDVWRCLGRGPLHSGTGATGAYHQSHEQKALNFISISILFSCTGGVDPDVRCAAHTGACVCGGW